MPTKPSRAEKLASEMGLEFTTQLSPDGKWMRFTFKYPGLDEIKVSNTITWPKATGGELDSVPASVTEAVQRVTRWRERVSPWLVLGTVDTVAAEQTLWTRMTVAKWNRKNAKQLRKVQKELSSGEAFARKLAQSQTTPMQALNILASLAPKMAEPATQELHRQLTIAAQQAERVMADAKAHAGGACSCAEGELCAVGVQVRAEHEAAQQAAVH